MKDMKECIFLSLMFLATMVIFLLVGLNSFAQLSPTQSQAFSEYSLIGSKNPGAENGKQFWSASGGTFTTTTTAANVGRGRQSFSWDSSAASQTLSLSSTLIPSGLYGRSSYGSCMFQCDSGTCTHLIEVTDGSNVLAAQTIVSSLSYIRTETPDFIMPSSGSLVLRVSSVASNEPTLYIDDCEVKSSFGRSLAVAQAQHVGSSSFAGTSGCTVSATPGGTWTDLGTTAACPGPTIESEQIGSWQTTDANGLIQTINNLPAGIYQVIFSSSGGPLTNAATCGFRLDDGTTQSGFAGTTNAVNDATMVTVVGYFTYTSSGNRTFNLQTVKAAATAGACQLYNDDTARISRFEIKRWPINNEIVVRPDQSPQFWSGYHDNTCSWARTNTAYGDPTADATCNLNERVNTNFGTVSTSGGVLPAITFTPNASGAYFVCASPKFAMSNLAATGDIRLWDGSNVIAETQQTEDVANDIQTHAICGLYRASTNAAVTLSLQTSASAGSITIAANSSNNSSVEWSIINVTKSVQTPLIAGSITSNSSSVQRLERAAVSVTGVVSNESGNWITSNCALAASVFTCTLESGIFSATPVCTATISGTSAGEITATPASATSVVVRTFDSSGSVSDRAFNLICQGTR